VLGNKVRSLDRYYCQPSQVGDDVGLRRDFKLTVDVSAPDAQAKPLVSNVDGRLKVLRIEDVVVIDKDKQRSAGFAYSPNPGMRLADCVLPDMPTERMPGNIVLVRNGFG
jgi:hypothetical protein